MIAELRRTPGVTAAVVLLVAALAWLVVIRQAAGMTSAPGTMGYGLLGFLGLWTVMMAAMMLPAVAPVAIMYVRVIDHQATPGRRPLRLAGLVLGYLLAWAGFGLLAFAAADLAGRLADAHPRPAEWIGAGLLAVAGIYQLTPVKDRCLAHCRSPLSLLVHVGSYRGRLRDVRAGLYHGGYCVGCCWALMLALIALGVMDLRWMVAFATVIVLEKLWRYGKALSYAVGVGLLVLAVLAPSHPELIPGLHAAGGMGGMGGGM
jgi:predicted metal-binding membrane protein